MNDRIAIIGIGCRFPGAETPAQYWNLLTHGVSAITDYPWNRRELRHTQESVIPGMRRGGFLSDIDKFDHKFFQISPREARKMDPQQRLLLEVAWEAIEDAGIKKEHLFNSATGVFIGAANSDYGRIVLSSAPIEDAYSGTGSVLSIIANRISYFFGFNAPSIVFDTACSSALVALHYACRSLLEQECKQALVGGVNLIITPEVTNNFTRAGLLSPTGSCHPFDASANGYLRGEGVGVVVLKPFQQAIQDGDRIYATIQGSAINHNGHANGLMAPNLQAQLSLLDSVYKNFPIQELDYIETQGLGTLLGDAIELNAISTFLAERNRTAPLLIGSVKPNIGHLEAASGVASLIKTTLSLYYHQIPPTLHFQSWNPHVPKSRQEKLEVVSSCVELPGQERYFGGVSAFGFGGVNAHVILENQPSWNEEEPTSKREKKYYTLALSAKSQESLNELANSYRNFLQFSYESIDLSDICYTAATRRVHHEYRAALVSSSKQGMRSLLDAFLERGYPPYLSQGRLVKAKPRKVVFLFPGDIPEKWRLDSSFLEVSPIIEQTMNKCRDIIKSQESSLPQKEDWKTIEWFIVQIAFAEVWKEWGIAPKAAFGYGPGEIVAMYVTGAVSLPEALTLISLYSRTSQLKMPLYIAQKGRLDQKQILPLNNWIGNFSAISSLQEEYARLLRDGYEIVLEINPIPSLSKNHQNLLHLPTLRMGHSKQESILLTLADLYTSGLSPEWDSLFTNKEKFTAVPTYAWQKESFWYTTEVIPKGKIFVTATPEQRKFWEAQIYDKEISLLPNESLLHSLLYYASAQVYLVKKASIDLIESSATLSISSSPLTVQISFLELEKNHVSFLLSSKPADADTWTLHATGKMTLHVGKLIISEQELIPSQPDIGEFDYSTGMLNLDMKMLDTLASESSLELSESAEQSIATLSTLGQSQPFWKSVPAEAISSSTLSVSTVANPPKKTAPVTYTSNKPTIAPSTKYRSSLLTQREADLPEKESPSGPGAPILRPYQPSTIAREPIQRPQRDWKHLPIRNSTSEPSPSISPVTPIRPITGNNRTIEPERTARSWNNLPIVIKRTAPVVNEEANPISPIISLDPKIKNALYQEIQKSIGSATVTIDPEAPLADYGIDSVIAAELKSQIELSLGITVPVVSILGGARAIDLEAIVVEQLQKLAQKDLLSSSQGKEITSFTDVKFLEQEAVLDADIVPKGIALGPENPRAVLLTGVTGFLGAFLLRELLLQTQTHVYCLVRAKNKEEGFLRLKKNAEARKAWSPSFASRITVIAGDLGRPRFGLSPNEFDHLGHQIEALYHCGATINFVDPYPALKPMNVLGTQEMLRLATLGKTKPFHHISSSYIFFTEKDQTGATANVVKEEESLEARGHIALGYQQTKWVADKLVSIAQTRNIPCDIYRPSWIAGESQTGNFNAADFICRMIKQCVQMNSAPDFDAIVTLTPVDFVSKAAVHLSRKPQSKGKAFHLVNPEPTQWREIVEALRNFGYPIRTMPYERWKTELTNAASRDKDHAMRPFLGLLALEDAFGLPFLLRMPRFDCQEVLDGLVGSSIACPVVDSSILALYIRTFVESGFLPPPPR